MPLIAHRLASIALIQVVLAATAPSQAARPSTASQTQVERIVHEIRGKHGVPAIAALVLHDGEILASAAAGVRRTDRDQAVTREDRWHLGSCTKSMTATLVAILGERELLGWDATLGSLLAKHAPTVEVHDDLHDVTIDQLLRHRSGLAANPPRADYLDAARSHPDDVAAQRQLVMRRMLARPAEHGPAGSTELYSNTGYLVAGALTELVTEKSWEDLMRTELFEPLGMASAGFGPPGSIDATDEPFGHASRGEGEYTPLFQDNPAALGPAGTVHATLADWAKYTRLHLLGMRGAPTGIEELSAATFSHLHNPAPNPNYASGWVVTGAEGRRQLWHNGSNTMWYVECRLLEAEDLAVLVATNTNASQSSALVMRRILTGLKKLRAGADK